MGGLNIFWSIWILFVFCFLIYYQWQSFTDLLSKGNNKGVYYLINIALIGLTAFFILYTLYDKDIDKIDCCVNPCYYCTNKLFYEQ